MQTAQLAVLSPALAGAPRCAVALLWMDASGLSFSSGQAAVLCIQIRDVAESVWHFRHRVRRDCNRAVVRSAVSFARLKCVVLPLFAVWIPDSYTSLSGLVVCLLDHACAPMDRESARAVARCLSVGGAPRW